MHNDKPRGRPPHADILTPAEWRVVQLAKHGHTNATIAEKLNLTINTVKYHLANATSKLGINSKAELLKWSGAPADSLMQQNQKMRASNMQNKSMIKFVGQIGRTVRDIVESEKWYREVLGLTHLYTFGQLCFFDCGGVRLFLSESKSGQVDNSIIYFQTDDIQSAYEMYKRRGVDFSHSPHKVHQHEDGTEEWMAFINDPDGQPIGLIAI